MERIEEDSLDVGETENRLIALAGAYPGLRMWLQRGGTETLRVEEVATAEKRDVVMEERLSERASGVPKRLRQARLPWGFESAENKTTADFFSA